MKNLWTSLLVASGLLAGTASYGSTFIVTSNARMTSVMDSVKAGDVVQINDGTYTVAPIPTHSGTASSRIRIIGNTANGAAVIVGAMSPAGCSYVTWNAMNFNGSCKIATYYTFNYVSPTADSVVNCRAYSGECGTSGSTNVVFKGDTLGDNTTDCSFIIKSGEIGNNCVNPSVVNCIMYLKKTAPTDDKLFWAQGIGGPPTTITGMTLTNNKINLVFQGTAVTNGMGYAMYYVSGLTSSANKFQYWDSTAAGMNTDNIVMLWRDGDINWTCTSDTFIVQKGTNTRFELSSSGNQLIDTGHRKFTSCVFRNLGTPKTGRGAFNWQNGIVADTLQNCIFAASNTTEQTILLYDVHGGHSVWDHCTILHSPYFGGISLSVAAINNAGISIRNCLFLANSNTASASNSSIFTNLTGSVPGQYARDYNLYAYTGKTSTLGDRAIRWTLNGLNSTFSAAGTAGNWYLNYGLDAHSKWGYAMPTPSLAPDSSAANVDSVLSTSAGATSDEFGGTIGAVPVSADVTRPFAIADLAVSSTSTNGGAGPGTVNLAWSATGDDSITGTAQTYTIKYSTANITAGNFAAATTWPQTKVPAAVTVAEAISITGLSLNSSYYFALIATDDAGNPSAISNVVSVFLSPGGGGRGMIPDP